MRHADASTLIQRVAIDVLSDLYMTELLHESFVLIYYLGLRDILFEPFLE